ncbi:hypothetical protein TWF481_011779 [Arthrobotrys musiformis]|uniref:Uncharacterized protein n=1 Tax=Arthrobotrys musiformis TaxID=47236 RepID=A0AAV9VWX4_9PEZI
MIKSGRSEVCVLDTGIVVYPRMQRENESERAKEEEGEEEEEKGSSGVLAGKTVLRGKVPRFEWLGRM